MMLKLRCSVFCHTLTEQSDFDYNWNRFLEHRLNSMLCLMCARCRSILSFIRTIAPSVLHCPRFETSDFDPIKTNKSSNTHRQKTKQPKQIERKDTQDNYLGYQQTYKWASPTQRSSAKRKEAANMHKDNEKILQEPYARTPQGSFQGPEDSFFC